MSNNLSPHQKEIQRLLNELDIHCVYEFVPWSRSRNAKEKEPTMNWKVTVLHKGRVIVDAADYQQGCAHTIAYQKLGYKTVDGYNAVHQECESGKFTVRGSIGQTLKYEERRPFDGDVLYSLMIDSDVLEYPSFEDWASNFGYDSDSRKAEAIYNECMKTALKMRTLGYSVMSQLREAFQDY